MKVLWEVLQNGEHLTLETVILPMCLLPREGLFHRAISSGVLILRGAYREMDFRFYGVNKFSRRTLFCIGQMFFQVVCYIYFTRIVVMIFDMTVPFRYTFLNPVFREGGTFVFFILTGYTFRPTLENPYLLLSQEELDEDDVEMDDVVVYDRKHNSDQVTLRSSNTKILGSSENLSSDSKAWNVAVI